MGARRVGALRWRRLLPGVLLVAAVVLGGWLLSPRGDALLPATSVLNVLFGSAWVVGVARLVGVVVALYVVGSILVRARNGQWLVRLGSADTEVEEQADAVTEDRQRLQEELDRSRETVAQLRGQLTELDQLLDGLGMGGTTASRYGVGPGATGSRREGDGDDAAGAGPDP